MLNFTLLVLCVTFVFLEIEHAIIGIRVSVVQYTVFTISAFLVGTYFGVPTVVKEVLRCAEHNELFAYKYRIIDTGKELEEPGRHYEAFYLLSVFTCILILLYPGNCDTYA
jgi:hypothetical protein